MATINDEQNSAEIDPVYLHGRREVVVVLIAWACCVIWCVSYCYTQGYNLDGESISITLGVPTWIFWGVLIPWIVAAVFSFWFALCFMVDEDLGDQSSPTAADEPRGDAPHE
jgi:hypothetical protein